MDVVSCFHLHVGSTEVVLATVELVGLDPPLRRTTFKRGGLSFSHVSEGKNAWTAESALRDALFKTTRPFVVNGFTSVSLPP